MNKMQRDQAYYDSIKQKFAEERDLRLGYRPEGTEQFTSDFSGNLAKCHQKKLRRELRPHKAFFLYFLSFLSINVVVFC